jgi:hypothetical protein
LPCAGSPATSPRAGLRHQPVHCATNLIGGAVHRATDLIAEVRLPDRAADLIERAADGLVDRLGDAVGRLTERHVDDLSVVFSTLSTAPPSGELPALGASPDGAVGVVAGVVVPGPRLSSITSCPAPSSSPPDREAVERDVCGEGAEDEDRGGDQSSGRRTAGEVGAQVEAVAPPAPVSESVLMPVLSVTEA